MSRAGARAAAGSSSWTCGAVDVPAGEGAVLRLMARGHACAPCRRCRVPAVGVADDVRVQQGVVERGVEGGALGVGAAADLIPPSSVAPGAVGRASTASKVRFGGFSAARLAFAPAWLTYEMPTLTPTGPVPGSNVDVAARALARDGTAAGARSRPSAGRARAARGQRVVLPGAGGLEGAVEGAR